MNMAEPFTDADLQTLAAKESRARQHMENQSSLNSFVKESEALSQDDPPAAPTLFVLNPLNPLASGI
jgi:hypothetical protein